MTQPSFVPIAEADQVRPSLRLETPRPWVATRPSELRFPVRPGGRQLGAPGPDQGYAIWLARRFMSRIDLRAGEVAEDVLVGCALVASRRAALVGRAPTVHDVEAALTLWGFLTPDAPEELVALRRHAFSGAAHDYVVQRSVVDRVPEPAIGMPARDAAAAISAGDWRQLVGA